MAWLIKVVLTDGNCGVGAANGALVKIDESGALVGADCDTYSTGKRIEFNTPNPAFRTYNWEVAVSHELGVAKSFSYYYKNMKANKTIEEALEKKAVARIAPVAPAFAAAAAADPNATRRLAIYMEEGIPVGNVAWHTPSESGVTNSLGEVWVSDLTSTLTMTMLNFELGGLSPEEVYPVTINATDLYSSPVLPVAGGRTLVWF